jgi:hypothetical protein
VHVFVTSLSHCRRVIVFLLEQLESSMADQGKS